MKYGFVKSKLDGTEEIFTSSQPTPKEFRYKMGKIIDLGDKPICTACAVDSFLSWLYNKEFDLYKIFNNSYPTKDGAELKNVLIYLNNEKLINNFALIKSEEVLKVAIMLNGPCVAGMPVYSTGLQFWEGPELEGGHAIAIVGWNEKGFIIRNSWGEHWGFSGYTVLPYNKFKKFLEIWTLIK